jgi:hypothetical protein
VFNEISSLTGFYWLELYKYKILLKLETGMEKKLARKTKTRKIGGVPGWILMRWNVGMADQMFWC